LPDVDRATERTHSVLHMHELGGARRAVILDREFERPGALLDGDADPGGVACSGIVDRFAHCDVDRRLERLVVPPVECRELHRERLRERPTAEREHPGAFDAALADEGDVRRSATDVHEEGTDLTVISYSRMAAVALDVARRLEEENNLSIEVVDLRSLRPLDHETIISSVKKTNRAIVFEEDWRSFGIGAEIAATLQEEAFDDLDAPIKRVASLEVPLPYSKPLELATLTGAKQLIDAINELAPRRRRTAS